MVIIILSLNYQYLWVYMCVCSYNYILVYLENISKMQYRVLSFRVFRYTNKSTRPGLKFEFYLSDSYIMLKLLKSRMQI